MNDESPNVLMVDDEPLNLMVLEAFLQGEGYRITKALNGADALRMAAENPPNLVLLDVMMPGMHGLEVCSRLKGDERTRNIPVVLVTSLDEKSGKINAVQAGAVDFIAKPVNKTELLGKVREALNKK